MVWCSAADTHLKLHDRVVNGACFIAGGVLNCDLSHRRSVAVLCMLYKIKCNPKHPLCGALPNCALCASVGYTQCFDRTSVYFCASPLQNLAVSQDFYSPLSLWNDLVDPVFDGVGLAGFKSRSDAFLLA